MLTYNFRLTFIQFIFIVCSICLNSNFGSVLPEKFWCYFGECCNEKYIPADFNKLEIDLQKHVYGQHIMQDTVVPALRAHWMSYIKPKKPLTLSFHGWPGSGKNYVTTFIQNALYLYGSKSSFTKQYVGRIDFPLEGNTTVYGKTLLKEIRDHVLDCPKQLFIFDEVDKMPEGVLNVLKPILDYRENLQDVDYRQCIFIFLSNTGARLINDQALRIWKAGRKREELTLKDFEQMITQGAFNEEGGFHFSDAIRSNLIDHYVPFLPLEYQHVKKCIMDEFKQRKIYIPSKEDIEDAMNFIEWGPNPEKIYSKTGCKRLSQKVGMITAKRRYGKETKSEL